MVRIPCTLNTQDLGFLRTIRGSTGNRSHKGLMQDFAIGRRWVRGIDHIIGGGGDIIFLPHQPSCILHIKFLAGNTPTLCILGVADANKSTQIISYCYLNLRDWELNTFTSFYYVHEW